MDSSSQIASDARQRWLCWSDGTRSPAMNMAVDEALLAHADELRGQPLLRIYDWDTTAISIGYAQRLDAVPTTPATTVVRRPTGGGIVHHDRDLTYTVVVPAAHRLANLDRQESYRVFHRAVVRLLATCEIRARLADTATPVTNRATMQCFVSPTIHDVLWDGGKAAGAAQRRTRDGILHQGSILLAPTRLARADLAARLPDAFAAEFTIAWDIFSPSPRLLADATDLATGKYADPDWIRRK